MSSFCGKLFLGIVCAFLFVSAESCQAEETLKFGFGKRDITPTEPMRLSGYSNRTIPAKDAYEKLHVRSMVFEGKEGERYAIVSVDLLGLSAQQNAKIARRVEATHQIPRERLVVSCTHTHTGPQLTEPASNLLSTPFTEEETRRAIDFAERLTQEIVGVIGDSITDLKPGKMFLGEGQATFAMNRRKLIDGKWVMVPNPEGPVDHSLPFLKITDSDGTIRGLIFNYACHATTLGPNDNQYNPDWPGFAAKFLEEAYPGAFALSLIGCGADANPEPRAGKNIDAIATSIAHGRAAAAGVKQGLEGKLTEIKEVPVCSFGYAGIAFDLPSAEELKQRLTEQNVTIRQHAANMLEILKRKRMLPSTYPLPLQTWQFGNDLTMVFMGGEVVVDYAIRLKKELQPGYVWVTAYTNDDPGYIASERVRSEGGYEVDYSMYFYNQPGRWATGTEELIIDRIKALKADPQAERARNPDESLQLMQVPPGFRIEAVATEPLVMDPVNFAFGHDGKLWVVEMADYPLGENGKPIGRVAFLEDDNQDGKFDRRTLFLDGLEYPTGVIPWKNGVLVSAAPEIFFAADTNGDGKADERQTLYSGFGHFNPQHRMNGFAYGLDGRLYLAGGDPNRVIHSEILNKDVEILGNDFRIEPESGQIEAETGRTQFGRSRDDWGNWFGNDNSRPWFHYVLPERAVRRNPYVVFPRGIVNAYGTADTHVFPTSRVVERFNELHTANRFTSACSPAIFRDSSLGPEFEGTGFICDPVHNLIQQVRLSPDGVTFKAERIAYADNREFLSSADTWSRPVRVTTGPDGCLWVADMYRQVIEHPEWIPEHWQSQLNLRAGAERGRIYRICRVDQQPKPWPQLATMQSSEVAALIGSSNGTLRDMAQRELIARAAKEVQPQLEALAKENPLPQVRAQSLWTMYGLGSLTEDFVEAALYDTDPHVVEQGVRLCAEGFPNSQRLLADLAKLTTYPDIRVRFQLGMALGAMPSEKSGDVLADLLLNNAGDVWISAAAMSSLVPHVKPVLQQVLTKPQLNHEQLELIGPLTATMIGSSDDGIRACMELLAGTKGTNEELKLRGLAALVQGIEKKQTNIPKLRESWDQAGQQLIDRLEGEFQQAGEVATNEEAAAELRMVSITLLGRGSSGKADDLQTLAGLVKPGEPQQIQLAALDSLARLSDPQVSQLLLTRWREQSPASQGKILETLLSRPIWTMDLVQSLEQGDLTSRDLDASSRGRLLNHTDPDVKSRAEKVLANQITESRQKVLAEYESVKGLSGDPQRGREIFKKTCSACHRYHNEGTQIGANLASLQDRTPAALLTAILDPNQAVEGKYKSYAAALKDGRILTGMIVEESATNITLAMSNGTSQTLLRSDLETLASTGISFMPEGLEKDLTHQNVADVIAFLQSAEK